MALTRERILCTALDLLRRYGLGDLSMRRVAQELDVAPGALYYHVRNKQELLVLLAGRILSSGAADNLGEAPAEGAVVQENATQKAAAQETVPQDLESTRMMILVEAAAVREALLNTQDAAEVVTLAVSIHPESIRPLARIRTLLTAAGLSPSQAGWGSLTVLYAVLGFVSAQQNRQSVLGRGPDPTDDESFAYGITAVVTGLLR